MKWVIMFVLFIFSMAPAYAQKRRGVKVDPLKQEFLMKLKGTDSFVSAHQTYAFLPKLKAVNQRASAKIGFYYQSSGNAMKTPYGRVNIVEKKGAFLIFPMTTAITSLNAMEQKLVLPVVLNLRTKQYGVFLNTFIVNVNDTTTPDQIAADYGLTLLRFFPRLGVASFKLNAASTSTVMQQFNSLKSDRRISSVSLDIIENINIPL